MRYSSLFWTHLSLLLLLILDSTDLITGANSCPSNCGNISILYPFGIGKGCYLDEWFEIQCNNSTSGKLVPYLPKINKEVVSINLPSTQDNTNTFQFGSFQIKTNITSTGCSGSNSGEILNFTNTPFTVSPANILVAVGCNNKATLTHLGPRLVGCRSSCGIRIKRDTSDCKGYKCCQANLPAAAQIYSAYSGGGMNEAIASDDDMINVIGISIEDIITNQTQSCRVGFLTDELDRYSSDKLTDPQWFHNQTYATVQLRWVLPNMNRSFINYLGCRSLLSEPNIHTCQCIRLEESGDFRDGSCNCLKGYEGNPYRPGGCKDIDECQQFGSDGKSLYCSESHTCVNTQGDYRCVNKRNKILKITIGFSVGCGVLILIGVTVLLYKFIKRRKEVNRKKKFFKRNGGLLLQQPLTSNEGKLGSVEKTKVFNSKELEKATENFSSTRVLGQGGQGTVYKGMLVDGSIVAVKKSTVVDEDKVEEFINEVVILSQTNHRHIVKLLGCCLETDVPLLVYEFIPNGNLFEHLHDESDDYMMGNWEVRLRIALDIAEAVSYLHSAASSPIYHRDIKTTNIMLDEKHRGKVSDFGTSRTLTVDQTHLTTVVSGTFGYLDPEYFQTSQFTDKSDVYSFGVVLVELITGQKPVRTQENISLATYFIQAMKNNKLVDTIDPRIRDDCKLEQVVATALLAKRCLNLNSKRRPSMRAVAMELERIRSPNGNSLSHVEIVENEEDEVDAENTIGLKSFDNVGVTAPVLQDNTASHLELDAEPLFPRQTW